ncbi:MAG: GNAT family N-acetyltransferase [Chitinophagaceae bacterium]|nr:GNAT family N-acetyltransferase [Chitinophagaceae bacterium]
MQIRRLSIPDTSALLAAINGAFADYIVPFQLTAAQLNFKMMSESIRPEWSVGVFEAGRLIAFILHGVRTAEGKTMVYNAGTGVLPAHRGKGLVGKMYEYILPFFKENHVNKLVLEVIEGNRPARHAYEKNGFSIRRKLWCFGGVLSATTAPAPALIKSPGHLEWDLLQSFWDIHPSWQSAIPTMDLARANVLAAWLGEELSGYILFRPESRRIYQLAVAPQHRRKGIATQLLAAVQQQMPEGKVQFNNVDEAAAGLKLCLEKQGLKNELNQFEMTRDFL